MINKIKNHAIKSLLIFLLLPLIATVKAADTINLEDSINFSLGTWSGSGGVDVDSNEFCVLSKSTSGFFFVSTRSEDYRVGAYNNSSASIDEAFRLKDGTNLLPITMTYKDSTNGSSEVMTAGFFGSNLNNNGLTSCSFGNTNGQINITIPEANLLASAPGNYQETMIIVFDQTDASDQDTDSFTASITIPDLVQVSNMNDMSLGTWNGSGNLSASDGICIYRNGTGGYSVTFTGDGGSGSGTAFRLSNGSNNIDYSVSYNDGTGNQPITAGTILTGRSGNHNSSTSCDDGTNATITATVLESTLVSSPADTYNGTLTLLVAPE